MNKLIAVIKNSTAPANKEFLTNMSKKLLRLESCIFLSLLIISTYEDQAAVAPMVAITNKIKANTSPPLSLF